ncbi:MAG TPA: DUF924 family protein [bacterium]|nr:DUF924 family protein [bacterium]
MEQAPQNPPNPPFSKGGIKSPRDILDFWWGEAADKWWSKDPAFDGEIRRRFEPTLRAAARGELDSWREEPESCLAYILLLDQFSRNIYRDSPQAFAQDRLALAASLEGQRRGFDQRLRPEQRIFFYMPMEHSEDREIQAQALQAFGSLGQGENLDYARGHAQIIERFGRFPHRNKILGRESTPEEEAFLKEPNSAF